MARHRGLIAAISVGTLSLALAGVVANAQPPQEAAAPGATTAAAAVGPPNVVLIVTDDQSPETLPHTPPVMPYLQERITIRPTTGSGSATPSSTRPCAAPPGRRC